MLWNCVANCGIRKGSRSTVQHQYHGPGGRMPVLLVLCTAVDIVGNEACFDVGVVDRRDTNDVLLCFCEHWRTSLFLVES